MQQIPITLRRTVPFALLTILTFSLYAIFMHFPDSTEIHAQTGVGELPACRAGLEVLRAFEAPEPVEATEPTEAPTIDPNAPTPTEAPPPPTPRPAPSEDRIGFPENYTEDFKLLFVFDRPNNQQVRAICGNDIAASTAEGEPFPYGSVLVMETWVSKKDADGVPVLDEDGHYIRERLTGAFVQGKEEGFGEAYGDDRSGEWEYVAYRPDGASFIPPERTNACAECHLNQGGESIDYVFRMNLLYQGEDVVTSPPAEDNEIPISVYAFRPDTLTVEVGTTVTWINYDEAEHIIKIEGLFESPLLRSVTVASEPETFSFTFDEVGTYEYLCTIHPTMTGVIEVVEASD